MRRREFIRLLSGAAVTWPLHVRAQQREGLRRIGVLIPYPEGDAESETRVKAFQQALQQLGWTTGRNIYVCPLRGLARHASWHGKASFLPDTAAVAFRSGIDSSSPTWGYALKQRRRLLPAGVRQR